MSTYFLFESKLSPVFGAKSALSFNGADGETKNSVSRPGYRVHPTRQGKTDVSLKGDVAIVIGWFLEDLFSIPVVDRIHHAHQLAIFFVDS